MKNRPMIFVCSPFGGQFHNMRNTTSLIQDVIDAGGTPYVPHLILPWVLSDCPNERREALSLSKSALIRCNALYVKSPRLTDGMREEIAFAKEHEIPYLTGPLELKKFIESLNS